MDISVIIVSWNVRALLERCLRSLYEHSSGVACEVIVVDNASSDGTADMVARLFPQVRLVANDANRGFAAANNQGAAVSSGRLLFFLNPDTELTENSLQKLIDVFRAHPEAGAVGPQLRYGDGSVQPTVKRDPTGCDQAWVLTKLFHWIQPACVRRYLAKDWDYRREQAAEQLMGAAIAVRADIFRSIGGWDESYFLWWEDVDLCTRLRQAGNVLLYTPATAITHHEGKSFAQQLSFKKQLRFTRGMRIYFRAHRPYWEYISISFLIPISLLLALGVQVVGIRPRTQSKA